MAFPFSPSSIIPFFDPNVGEYKIQDAQKWNFFNEYQKILKDKFQWTLGAAWAYQVFTPAMS